MVITLTPDQFKDLNEVIETSRRAMSSTEQGELTLQNALKTDSIEWSTDEVIITLTE